MKNKILTAFWLMVLFVVVGCAPAVTTETLSIPSPRPSPKAGEDGSLATVSPTTMVTLTPSPDLYAEIHVSETAIALQKEQIAQAQLELGLQLTRDAATSTEGAAMTSTSVAYEQATLAAGTQIAGTQTAIPLTQTVIPLTENAMKATQEIESLNLKVKKVSTVIWPILFAAVFLAFSALGWDWLRKRIASEHFQKSQMKPDEKGRIPVVPVDTIPGKDKRILNPNLAHRAVTDPNNDDLSAEQALENAKQQRHLEGVRVVADSLVARRLGQNTRKAGETGAGNGAGVTVSPVQPAADKFLPLALPDWKQLNQWDGTLLPYGVDGNNRLLTVDPAKRPHLMITGTTGTGKTRYEIRTVVAGALTSGWQVIAVGKQVDYMPFEEHPNVTLIPANAIKEYEKYIHVLKAASEQMYARDELLVSKRISTWERYGGPQTLIVIDDYSTAMMQMPTGNAKDILKWLLALAMEGRKYGLNLLLGLQRASWTCISPDLRSQMGRIALRVESARDSRLVLDEAGAEALPDRHFLARLEDDGTLIHGAAFAMNDEETYAFLASRPVKETEKPTWIEGVTTSIPDPSPKVGDGRSDNGNDDVKSNIIDAYLIYVERGESPNYTEIQRVVYGQDDPSGGAHFNFIKKVIAEFEGITVDELAALNAKRTGQAIAAGTTTTTAITTGNLADPGPVAA